MTKHKTFQQLYTVLLDFIKQNKRIPSSSSTDKEEKRLGNWCYQLRKKYRLQTLHQDATSSYSTAFPLPFAF